jgi:DHA1 family tetracycline resistance protein-like MFS transporter
MLALGIIVPVLPKLVLEFEGGDSAHAATIYGLFGTTFAAMQFLFAPLLGALSDRFGRRPVVLLSNFGLGLDYVVMALAPSVSWLLAGRVVSGICGASYTTAGAYIADVTLPEKRAASFGLMSAAFGVGFVVGPAVGGLVGNIDPRLPFWVAAAMSLANASYGLVILPESLPPERRAPFEWRRANPMGSLHLLRGHAAVLGLAAMWFLSDVAHEVMPSTFVLYTDHRYAWDARTVGLSLAAVGLSSAIVGAGLVGRIVARLGERRSLLLGQGFGAAGFAVAGLATTGLLFCASIPILAMWGLWRPAAQAVMTSRVGPTEQGRLQGALAGLQGIAFMIGPVLFTSTFATAIRGGWSQPGAPFLLAALMVGVALGVGWRATRA